MKPLEYSIWLMPQGETYVFFKNLIKTLAEKYNSVPFEPHVTLIGAGAFSKEEMIFKTQELAKTTHPFTIKLKKVDYLDEFYRCVFVKAEKTEELVDLNNRSRKMFSGESDPEFMPHMSLLYGTYEETVKKEIIKEIGVHINLSFEVTSLFINEFININDVESVKKWNMVGEFPLQK